MDCVVILHVFTYLNTWKNEYICWKLICKVRNIFLIKPFLDFYLLSSYLILALALFLDFNVCNYQHILDRLWFNSFAGKYNDTENVTFINICLPVVCCLLRKLQ